MTKVVTEHGLKPRSAQEYQRSDDELNAAYRTRIALYGPDFKCRLQSVAAAKQAQRLWLKLHPPWLKLCEEVYRGDMSPQEIERAIGTELREVRIIEIRRGN
ncbi:MAG TPA: lysozyme inhibitor LprI family protein [Steroidobacteraceae bacterium]|nr:lysozyme inhibitor LprI family protein [Steroidobacteraceae bacterium]